MTDRDRAASEALAGAAVIVTAVIFAAIFYLGGGKKTAVPVKPTKVGSPKPVPFHDERATVTFEEYQTHVCYWLRVGKDEATICRDRE